LAPAALQPVLPYPEPLLKALSDREWSTAARMLVAVDRTKLSGTSAGDHAFVTAWALARADRDAEALAYLEPARSALNAPPTYVHLLAGELLLEAGRPVDAAKELEAVPVTSTLHVRAELARARALDTASRRNDATRLYEGLAERPDPAPGGATVLAQLARRVGADSPRGKALLLRVYRTYPGSPEDSDLGKGLPMPTVTEADTAARADVLQEGGDYARALKLVDPLLAGAKADACVLRFAWGRAQFKQNNITAAAGVLEPLGKACRNKDEDRGAKALYLAAKAYERTKRMGDAARAYLAIPELYPAHSMADDGYALGGIALQEAGDLPGARKAWAKGYEAYPAGDLAPENAWRLAWGAWLAGDESDALRWADRARNEIAVARNPTEVLASVYWGARWRAWPSLAESKARTKDPARLAEATTQLEALARTAPWHWYGLMAAQRLRELSPERAASLTRPRMDALDAPWQVSTTWRHQPAVQDALGLVRVGLRAEALAELATLPDATLSGSEVAIACGIQTDAGRFLFAHDRLRNYLKSQTPDTLGPNAYKILRQAYPERYWDEVRAAAPYTWDPRAFHALVREESNFNPKIESHVGAKGLSQLMPATAAATARKNKIPYTLARIWDPETNLTIGAAYFDFLVRRYKGNAPMAMAGYNAGEGNADRWLAARPNAPLDVVVESISFRETRHYVKRVSSSWQTYRLLYETGNVYTDLSSYTFDAVPGP
jgi:soluble lytic murein transglycosylase-like protein